MIASLSASDSIIISQLFAEAMRAAEGLGAAGACTVVGVWACASNTEGGAARAWISAARAGTGAASTGVDGAVVPWSVERVWSGARDETGAGAELPHLALSTPGSAFHRWPRTLSLSALRKDVGSNGRCARQNSLSDRARSEHAGSAGLQISGPSGSQVRVAVSYRSLILRTPSWSRAAWELTRVVLAS